MELIIGNLYHIGLVQYTNKPAEYIGKRMDRFQIPWYDFKFKDDIKIALSDGSLNLLKPWIDNIIPFPSKRKRTARK